MLSHRKLLIGILLLLLGWTVYVRVQPQKCVRTVCAEPLQATLPYNLPGPYEVGKRVQLTQAEPPLTLQIWYPALPETAGEEANATPYIVKLGEPLGDVTIATSAGRASAAAPFDLAQAPYPLVVLSPGFAIGAEAYSWLGEHLASYGFVVVAPEHQESLDPQNELWRAAITRPQDILEVFAFVDAATQPGGSLTGLIDPEVTAVVGHSYGGYTALAAAGAQIDTASFNAHCDNAIQTDDPTAWLCTMLQPRLAEMAELAGLDSVPAGLWPTWADPRVDAIVPMAGDAYFFGQTGLAGIEVPLLAIGGTLDSDTPFLWGPQPAYEHAASPAKALLALAEAEHMVFTNTCESIVWYARLFTGEFCADSVWNRDGAHALTRHYTTAFLLAELQDDGVAAAYLAPGAADYADITYQAEGY